MKILALTGTLAAILSVVALAQEPKVVARAPHKVARLAPRICRMPRLAPPKSVAGSRPPEKPRAAQGPTGPVAPRVVDTPRSGRIRIHVVAGGAGQVRIHTADGATFEASADELPQALEDQPLAAGPVLIEAWSADRSSAAVVESTIVPDETTRMPVVLAPAPRLEGRALSARGPFQGRTFLFARDARGLTFTAELRADGSFVLPVVPGTYRTCVCAEDLVPIAREGVVVPAHGRFLDLVAADVGVASGRLVDREDRPLGNEPVRFREETTGGQCVVRTDARGEFTVELPPGKWIASAWQQSWGCGKLRHRVSLKAVEVGTRFTLEERGRVAGLVVKRTGEAEPTDIEVLGIVE